jgi:hypothetical protein
VFPPVVIKDVMNGEFVLYPGYGCNMHSVAGAGSTPLVLLGMTWEEVPIPQ